MIMLPPDDSPAVAALPGCGPAGAEGVWWRIVIRREHRRNALAGRQSGRRDGKMRVNRMGDELYERVWRWENLRLAHHKAARGKRGRGAAAAFEYNLTDHLLDLQHELRDQTYRPGAYRSFHIHKPKKRLISAAPFRDRVAHHALCNVIEPIFERSFIFDSYANRVGSYVPVRRHPPRRRPGAGFCPPPLLPLAVRSAPVLPLNRPPGAAPHPGAQGQGFGYTVADRPDSGQRRRRVERGIPHGLVSRR